MKKICEQIKNINIYKKTYIAMKINLNTSSKNGYNFVSIVWLNRNVLTDKK